MKQLVFTLETNKRKIIHKKVNYFITNNILKFNDTDTLYQYDIAKNIFRKKDKEKIIEINFVKKVIIITLINNNIKIDYPMVDCKCVLEPNSYKFEYSLEGEDLVQNTIYLEF